MSVGKSKIIAGISPKESHRYSAGPASFRGRSRPDGQAGGIPPNPKKGRVFVGLSGGVDSSVAALILKREGCDVTGVFMKNWADPRYPCPWEEDRRDAMRVAAKLDIPFQTWDFTKEYRAAVVEYMLREYAQGRTPNPDVMCNREIKFGLFLKRAIESGADFVATGHYVRREPGIPIFNDQVSNDRSEIENSTSENSLKIGNCKLKIARDPNKDQSYFLWMLGQEQLRRALFPIGGFTKPKVREIARRFGLPTAEKAESMGICFIGEINVSKFLRDHIQSTPGSIMTSEGKVVGEHRGLPFYTIGQREGLGIGGGAIAYYVAAKKQSTNTLVVAEGPYDSALFGRELLADEIHWISGNEPELPLRCMARIRYRQPLQKCTVRRFNELNEFEHFDSESKNSLNPATHQLKVVFDEPQRAIAPGQSAVFYGGESSGETSSIRLGTSQGRPLDAVQSRLLDETRSREMLGGGVIR